jgi:hypothetical protein
MSERVLSTRELNRTLLLRQGLLERSRVSAAEWIERLVGLQAQETMNPYVALWNRTVDYDPAELAELLESRAAVRGAYMRGTIHLVSARDALSMAAIHGPLMKRIFRGQAQFRNAVGDNADEIIAAGRELIEERPRTRAEVARELSLRWPDVDKQAIGLTVTYHLPLIQTTPRAVWGKKQQATWALTEQWLGRPLDPDPSIDELVLRYLRAFGPATVGDARTWSTLNGLREVFERLRPDLKVYRDERGRELFDVSDGEFADPDVPAPPRFLPVYDNVLLAHEDRARVMHEGSGLPEPWPSGMWCGNLIANGYFRCFWTLAVDDKAGSATLRVDRFTSRDDDPPDLLDAVNAEGEALLEFVAPDVAERRIVFDPAPA